MSLNTSCLAVSVESHPMYLPYNYALALSGILPAPDWRRPPGRPRRTWLQQLEEDPGQPVSSVQIMAIDRQMLRKLVTVSVYKLPVLGITSYNTERRPYRNWDHESLFQTWALRTGPKMGYYVVLCKYVTVEFGWYCLRLSAVSVSRLSIFVFWRHSARDATTRYAFTT